MQLSGEGGGAKAHKTSFHALTSIARTEGVPSLYKGCVFTAKGTSAASTHRPVGPTRTHMLLQPQLVGWSAAPGHVHDGPSGHVLHHQRLARGPQQWQRRHSVLPGTWPHLHLFLSSAKALTTSLVLHRRWRRHKKLLAGMLAGGFGAVIGTPAEVALIRMTSDGRLPPEQRRGYRNVFDALLRICREEGVLAMWRGCTLVLLLFYVVSTLNSSCLQARRPWRGR